MGPIHGYTAGSSASAWHEWHQVLVDAQTLAKDEWKVVRHQLSNTSVITWTHCVQIVYTPSGTSQTWKCTHLSFKSTWNWHLTTFIVWRSSLISICAINQRLIRTPDNSQRARRRWRRHFSRSRPPPICEMIARRWACLRLHNIIRPAPFRNMLQEF
jgi:hypothetical protein